MQNHFENLEKNKPELYKFNELNKLDDSTLDLEQYKVWEYVGDDEREVCRLMWGMCRDKYDKAMMVSYWHGGIGDDSKESTYQDVFIKKCEEVVSSYMSNTPTWIDVILK
tara:strand:- start:4226 stop:4555 length:330 start_codon:yes stop_codon:yes gene_type:complete